ncbi:TPA: hypothetical protein ACKQEX_001381 [Serratia marcescens]
MSSIILKFSTIIGDCAKAALSMLTCKRPNKSYNQANASCCGMNLFNYFSERYYCFEHISLAAELYSSAALIFISEEAHEQFKHPAIVAAFVIESAAMDIRGCWQRDEEGREAIPYLTRFA